MRRITPRRRRLAPCEREKPWRRAARRSALAATAATPTPAGLLLAAAPAQAGAGVSVDGEPPFTPYFGNYIGFIASSGSPNIYIGFFTGGPRGNNLGSVRTTDTSPYAPSVYGQVVLWKGYTNNLIYEGSITLGSNNLHSSAPFSNTTLSAPSNSGCKTSYEGTDYHIYYNNEPFFGCTVG